MASDAAQIDSTIDVITPENIAFQYQAAGPFRRLPAYLIDLTIRFAVMFAAFIVAIFAGFVFGALVVAMFLLLWFVLEWFYGGLFEAYWNGQTPGKWIMGVRVLTTEGQPINGLQAVMRNIMRYADMMPFAPFPFFAAADMPPVGLIPTFIVGLVVPMLNRRSQRLGDVVCGTMVVIEERSWLFGMAKLEDPRTRQLAEYLPPNYQVKRSLAKALATYVERRRFFAVPRRREIAKHLGGPLLAELNLPSDTSHDLLLCALYYRAFIAGHGDKEAEASPQSPFAVDTGQPTPPKPTNPFHIQTDPIGRGRH